MFTWHAQVVVGAHFVMRAATDPSSGALTLSAVQLSLVIADVAMPAAGPLVVDTAFSVEWANASVPDVALQVGSGSWSLGSLRSRVGVLVWVASCGTNASGGCDECTPPATQGLQFPADWGQLKKGEVKPLQGLCRKLLGPSGRALPILCSSCRWPLWAVACFQTPSSVFP